jgi:hypothetical protein
VTRPPDHRGGHPVAYHGCTRQRYYDSTRAYADGGRQVGTGMLPYDDEWTDTVSVPDADQPWQLEVTAFSPDGSRLGAGHSSFVY